MSKLRLIDLDKLKEFPIRADSYDKENGSSEFISGIESLMEYAENLQAEFDIDMVLDQLKDYGKYKGILKCDNGKSENYIPVSVAKQIVRGKGLGGVLGYLGGELNIMDKNIENKLKEWVTGNYKQYATGWTSERSQGNDCDCFDDGVENGTSWAAWQVGNILGMELEEPESIES